MLLVKAMPMDTQNQAREALLQAIKIEHATIPPYLTALYSLKPGKNNEIRGILSRIVVQEMEHMARAANILNAIDGRPQIDQAGFIPTYPGGLPFHIGDRQGRKLDIHLQRFSLELVTGIFMVIEEPDDPLHFPVHPQLAAAFEQTFMTIGDFYQDLRAKLQAGWFTGNPGRQVSGVVDAVHNLADAQAAIDIIVQQGEGTHSSPLGPDGVTVAHYYQFEEIANQRTLKPDKVSGFAFGPPSIPFSAADVWPTARDPRSALYPEGSQVRAESDLCNQIYSNLLRTLQQAFDGAPAQLDAAIGLMFDFKAQAQRLMAIALGDGSNASPAFEWVAP
jgi:rubrerythrin